MMSHRSEHLHTSHDKFKLVCVKCSTSMEDIPYRPKQWGYPMPSTRLCFADTTKVPFKGE